MSCKWISVDKNGQFYDAERYEANAFCIKCGCGTMWGPINKYSEIIPCTEGYVNRSLEELLDMVSLPIRTWFFKAVIKYKLESGK